MEYILFQIDEMKQQMVFCHYRDFSKGKAANKLVQRAFPLTLISEHEPRIPELIEGEIVGIFYEKRGENVVSELQYLDKTEEITKQEDRDWIESFVKKCCIDMTHDELLKPPSVDEQVEDFIKEFFENDESEALEQKDFLADFFDEVAESEESVEPIKEQETTETNDVVAAHFNNSEEEPLEEKDFLSEFFAELESEDEKK